MATTKAAAFRAIAAARRSAKRFQKDQSIPSSTLKDILGSTLRSPSSFNLQPSQIILVQNADIKQQLADEAMLGDGNQFRIKDCSAAAIFLSDMEAMKRIPRIDKLEKDWGGRHPTYSAVMPLSASLFIGEGHAALLAKQAATSISSNTPGMKPAPKVEPVQAWAYKNTALSVQSFVLAATSHDLATAIMEGFDARRAKEILRIPDRYEIPMMVATGYEYQQEEDEIKEEDSFTPRLAIEEVVFEDTFGEPYQQHDGGAPSADQQDSDQEDDVA